MASFGDSDISYRHIHRFLQSIKEIGVKKVLHFFWILFWICCIFRARPFSSDPLLARKFRQSDVMVSECEDWHQRSWRQCEQADGMVAPTDLEIREQPSFTQELSISSHENLLTTIGVRVLCHHFLSLAPFSHAIVIFSGNFLLFRALT